MVGAVWHYRKCPECGGMIFSKAQDSYNAPCPKCAKIHRELYHKNATFNFSDPDSYFVESDPLDFYEGGFRKGATITRIQAESMCNVGSFDDGTILYDKDHNRYEARTEDGKQRLIRL